MANKVANKFLILLQVSESIHSWCSFSRNTPLFLQSYETLETWPSQTLWPSDPAATFTHVYPNVRIQDLPRDPVSTQHTLTFYSYVYKSGVKFPLMPLCHCRVLLETLARRYLPFFVLFFFSLHLAVHAYLAKLVSFYMAHAGKW